MTLCFVIFHKNMKIVLRDAKFFYLSALTLTIANFKKYQHRSNEAGNT